MESSLRQHAPVLKLSNELLREVLDCIEADPQKLVAPERRAYLSQESFRVRSPPQIDQSKDIGNFRLVCKRFAKLGAVHQFAQVTTRFSDRGLERLEYIANQRHLARHVRKFAYMVPLFYFEGRDWLSNDGLSAQVALLNTRSFTTKAAEQQHIRSSKRDLNILKRALSAFASLQHVQVLRVLDHDDALLLEYLRNNESLQPSAEMQWSQALSHSIKTLAAAMSAAHNPCSRFSSPMMSSQSISHLLQSESSYCRSFAILIPQITSLELHFDDPGDLDARIRELSPYFRGLFTKTENLSAIHIGFPSHRPLSIPLETIFHNIKWPKLVAFGIQAWKLEATEIINLASRFSDRLRGLRLRDIILKEGSQWKHVLKFLRADMSRLSWVSLRRIGYAKVFDQVRNDGGVEVPDDLAGGDIESDSLDDSSDADDDSFPGQIDAGIDDDSEDDTNDSSRSSAQDQDDDDDDGYSDDEEEEDAERGPRAHEMEFPRLSPDRPDPILWCTCDRRPSTDDPESSNTASTEPTWEDLGDNGLLVTNMQRKTWEKWVVKRCPQHARQPR